MSCPADSLPNAPAPGPGRDTLRDNFRNLLAQKGMRVTSQRIAIFDAVFDEKDAFTAEQLLSLARKIDPSVSRSTVYRSIPILAECGLLREIDIGRDYKFYMSSRGRTPHQAQVICQDCDKIFTIEAPFMEWYGASVTQRLGLVPVSQRIQVHATCPNRDNCPNRRQ